MLSFRAFLAESNWMYHGTPKDFPQFIVNDNEHMIDRAIGIHFAADLEMSTKFAHGLYREPKDGWGAKLPMPSGGFLWRAKAPTASRTRVVPQKTYHYKGGGTAKGSDQGAVGAFVGATVFDRYPDLFIKWVMRRNNNNDKDLAWAIYTALKSGHAAQVYTPKPDATPKELALNRKSNNHDQSLRSFVDNYDSGLFMAENLAEIARAFNMVMATDNIDALTYINTSPSETERGSLRSSKCYILLTHALGKYPMEKIPLTAIQADVAGIDSGMAKERIQGELERQSVYRDLHMPDRPFKLSV